MRREAGVFLVTQEVLSVEQTLRHDEKLEISVHRSLEIQVYQRTLN